MPIPKGRIIYEQCRATHQPSRLICNLPKDHKGRHEAYGQSNETPLVTWANIIRVEADDA